MDKSFIARMHTAALSRTVSAARQTYLHDDEDGVSGTQLAHIAVHAADHVRDSFANSDEDPKELLSSIPAECSRVTK